MDIALDLAELGPVAQHSPAAIECQDLVKTYGKGKDALRAVDKVNIFVAQGTM